MWSMEHTLVLRALAAYPNEKTGSFIHVVKKIKLLKNFGLMCRRLSFSLAIPKKSPMRRVI
jgi:hypothetical protein